ELDIRTRAATGRGRTARRRRAAGTADQATGIAGATRGDRDHIGRDARRSLPDGRSGADTGLRRRSRGRRRRRLGLSPERDRPDGGQHGIWRRRDLGAGQDARCGPGVDCARHRLRARRRIPAPVGAADRHRPVHPGFLAGTGHVECRARYLPGRRARGGGTCGCRPGLPADRRRRDGHRQQHRSHGTGLRLAGSSGPRADRSRHRPRRHRYCPQGSPDRARPAPASNRAGYPEGDPAPGRRFRDRGPGRGLSARGPTGDSGVRRRLHRRQCGLGSNSHPAWNAGLDVVRTQLPRAGPRGPARCARCQAAARSGAAARGRQRRRVRTTVTASRLRPAPGDGELCGSRRRRGLVL
ncbi:MAG: Nicotinate-nucleotide--dimethylbenzimidazole phosphoribosyltransferase (EC 2.4.2.21), partial [Olavius algarvensis Gamma 1 endosymbiont]